VVYGEVADVGFSHGRVECFDTPSRGLIYAFILHDNCHINNMCTDIVCQVWCAITYSFLKLSTKR